MSSEQTPEERMNSVDRAFAEFRELWLKGKNPDKEDFCRDHPECGQELSEKIENFLFTVKGLHSLRETNGKIQSEDGEKNEIAIGRTLGDFRIIREIGRGGMGVVYEAEQISLRRRVALKVLPWYSQTHRRQERFQREAFAAAKLDHTHIVPIYHVGLDMDSSYIAMRYIHGKSLAEIIHLLQGKDTGQQQSLASVLEEMGTEKKAKDTVRTISSEDPLVREVSSSTFSRRGNIALGVELIACIARALEHAHSLGIFHRDVKPHNIIIDGNGRPYLTDFGLAKDVTLASISYSGELTGTIQYMSVEQVSSKRMSIDHRTDIYSLGVTLYELLALKRPFDGETREQICQ